MNKIILISFLIFSNSVFSDPVYRKPDQLNNGEKAELINKAHYKILGISIENTTLSELQHKIGNAEIYKGDHTANHICYKNKTHKIEFLISSLGYGYEVIPLKNKAQKCRLIDKVIVNDAGIKIGTNKSKILAMLGKPSKVQDSNVLYIYWIQTKISKEAEDEMRKIHSIPAENEIWLDKYSVINIKYKNNLVSQFSVNTTKTF